MATQALSPNMETLRMTAGTNGISRTLLWTARIMQGLTTLFLIMDGGMKLWKPPFVVEATKQIGFHESAIVPIGAVLLTCTILYVIPRTAVLGAVLLTGYLGGAVAANVIAGTPLSNLLFPVIFGALAWSALWLRNDRLRQLVPVVHAEER